jgi:hypothetical protein
MRSVHRQLGSILLFAAMASTTLLGGCAVHARVYDPYYHDYHAWNDGEVVYYGQWERDTHRDHVDFKQRNDADQKEYWTWRHSQPEHR